VPISVSEQSLENPYGDSDIYIDASGCTINGGDLSCE
jgi:hypothetical protein